MTDIKNLPLRIIFKDKMPENIKKIEAIMGEYDVNGTLIQSWTEHDVSFITNCIVIVKPKKIQIKQSPIHYSIQIQITIKDKTYKSTHASTLQKFSIGKNVKMETYQFLSDIKDAERILYDINKQLREY